MEEDYFVKEEMIPDEFPSIKEEEEEAVSTTEDSKELKMDSEQTLEQQKEIIPFELCMIKEEQHSGTEDDDIIFVKCSDRIDVKTEENITIDENKIDGEEKLNTSEQEGVMDSSNKNKKGESVRNTAEKMRTRWKTTRDTYIKSRNKSKAKKSVSTAKKVVKYHDQLQFLKRLQKRSTDSNIDLVPQKTDQEGACTSQYEEDMQSTAITAKVSPTSGKHLSKKTTRLNTPFKENLLKLLKESKEKDDDDDRAFLTSLLPSLKNFNEDQKLTFRAEVLQLIMRIKRAHRVSNVQTPSSITPISHNTGTYNPNNSYPFTYNPNMSYQHNPQTPLHDQYPHPSLRMSPYDSIGPTSF